MPSMYRKQFGIIAGILKENKASRKTILSFDKALMQTNPRFSEGKFLRASGMRQSKKGNWY